MVFIEFFSRKSRKGSHEQILSILSVNPIFSWNPTDILLYFWNTSYCVSICLRVSVKIFHNPNCNPTTPTSKLCQFDTLFSWFFFSLLISNRTLSTIINLLLFIYFIRILSASEDGDGFFGKQHCEIFVGGCTQCGFIKNNMCARNGYFWGIFLLMCCCCSFFFLFLSRWQMISFTKLWPTLSFLSFFFFFFF